VLLLLAVGCATPDRRIQRHPDVFAAFPTNVQANVRSGIVDVGYTPDMVYIALGRPDRVLVRETAEGRVEIWVYIDATRSMQLEPVETARWYRTRHGELRLARDWSWVDTGRWNEYEALRIEFKDDKVFALETRK
jgi:hypothetical protein